jgi:hypothetical protein
MSDAVDKCEVTGAIPRAALGDRVGDRAGDASSKPSSSSRQLSDVTVEKVPSTAGASLHLPAVRIGYVAQLQIS